ncbi:hypothetical protein CYMTET_35325 [Cymbomonas tetramitiformis]|uniref:TRP C-terminal domain-containing protein n=1 Tax=Cymbomonas tetramitiformis TaxID=36881 RepID=A0AAE0F9I5_9CHLO|nr:hypothetical protein CYMTET_35325 [Cymbomonas tetramitiformis]
MQANGDVGQAAACTACAARFVCKLTVGRVVLEHSVVQNNTVQGSDARGGAMLLETNLRSVLHIIASNLTLNQVVGAEEEGSYLQMYTSEGVGVYRALRGCGAAVAVVGDDSAEPRASDDPFMVTAVIDGCYMSENTVNQDGGALAAVGSTELQLIGLIASQNQAEAHAGVLFLAEGASAHISGGSVLEGNRAEFGGGVSLAMGAQLSMQDSTLQGNSAWNLGGALYTVEPAASTSLSNLSFVQNLAPNMDSVFWAQARPACANCSFVTSLFETGAQCSGLELDDLSPATSAGINVRDGSLNISTIEVVSGDDMQLWVGIYDTELRHICEVDNLTVYWDWRSNATEALLAGSTSQEYSEGHADFSELAIIGLVGQSYDLVLTTSDSSIPPLGLRVAIAPCRDGQEYDGQSICRSCPPNEIKFDNVSTSCTSCEGREAEIECRGENQYTVAEGYWLSPSIEKCATESVVAGDVAECFLEKVYQCDYAGACSGVPRETEGLSGVLSLTQCSEGYDHGVVLCGACEIGYEMQLDRSCAICPERKLMTYFQALGTVVGIMLFLFGGYLLWKRVEVAVLTKLAADGSSDVATIAARSNDTNNALSLFFGYMQVIGQLTLIFKRDVMPEPFLEMLEGMTFITVDFLDWMSLRCLYYTIPGSENNDIGGFPWMLTFYAVSPFLIATPVILMWWKGHFSYLTALESEIQRAESVHKNRRETRRQSQLQAILEAAKQSDNWAPSTGEAEEEDESAEEKEMHHELVKARQKKEIHVQKMSLMLTLVTFLLVFIHPSVSTYMIQVFRCQHLAYQESSQYWLYLDRRVECFTPRWASMACISCTVLLTYIAGFPLLLMYLLLGANNLKKVSIPETGRQIWVHTSNLVKSAGKWKVGEMDLTMRPQLMPAATRTIRHSIHTAARRKPAPMDENWIGVEPLFRPHTAGADMVDIESKLDDPRIRMLMGSFYIDFRRPYFYWNTYEIFRKLMQTSAVIFIQLMHPWVDKDYDLFFAMIVAVIALAIHGFCQPYVHPDDNFVQLLILCNQCLIVLCFIMVQYLTSDSASYTTGMILIIIQALMGIVIVYYVAANMFHVHKVRLHDARPCSLLRRLTRFTSPAFAPEGASA